MRSRLSQMAPQPKRKCLMSWQQLGLAYCKTLATKKSSARSGQIRNRGCPKQLRGLQKKARHRRREA